MDAPSRHIDAPTVPLDRTRFVQKCADKDAHTEDERAALAQVDRGPLRRWFKGEVSPLLPVARRVARRLDSTVDELWPEG